MMKTRNKLIICLAIMGIVLFGLVQGIVIPKNNQKKNEYMAQQQDPIIHDLNSILKYKTKYMGDSSNIVNLFNKLPLNNIQMSYELFPGKLTAELNYKDSIENIKADKVNKALIYNSTAAFALVDNLEVINYNFPDGEYKVLRSDVEKWYGTELTGLLSSKEWENKVQNKLKDIEYVDNFAKAVLKRK
jgi:hypothetical protein